MVPDIVLICESWLSEALDNSIIAIPGYNIIRQDRGFGCGDGLLFYITDPLITNPVVSDVTINFVTKRY